ncbi:D-alanyl-D-alanine carboxypeptidase family protein [Aristaeella lactis]|uniref:Peptidoglycan binding domain-containing protein n=1 Tax=Aristaeella lactis TaxID=3046383 RepID=A0AC61PM85_9FIRM|nr:D-alanyl-D-alanine carboxypeptidase family protein [Aristaeella lactis]QUA53095.1 D-alanyl-D-alanine carboxypeptidase family protein [Aristaeella lactis]SMC67503.1 Putative peptidoglycan binding domain-containing protein [Aristaeella lactis]
MKRSIRSLTALLMTVVLLLCLYPMMPALAESAADSSAQSTEEPEKKEKVSAETLQAQGILSVGAKGEDVTRLQQRLKDLGYLDGKVDGQYGGGTKRAVIAFQRMHGLTTDGVAGQETQEKLYAEDAKHAPDGSPVNVLEGDVPMLVNKDNPVPSGEFFVPADMVQLNKELSSKLVTIKYKKTRGVKVAVEALKAMLEAAKADGIGKWQVSAGYRSWDDQVNMLNSKVRSYQKSHKDWSSSKARRAALRTVAEPGCSEHHLGLAFDVNKKGASSFAGTKQSKWLNEHCWEYGFIIRYQKEKEKITGFEAEPWHIRYVGVEHALYMRDHDLCLEEYVQGLQDGSIPNPAVKAEEQEVPENAEEKTEEEVIEEVPEEEVIEEVPEDGEDDAAA